jgi:hypothetical protein
VHKIVKKQNFDNFLTAETLDVIFKLYIEKMEDYNDISKKFCMQDNGKFLLETFPSFLNSE